MFCNKFLALCTALLLAAGPASAELSVKTTRIGHDVDAWYVRNNSVPVVDIRLSFEGAGTVSDPSDKGGRAAFAAAMLTQGAGTLSAHDFQRALDEGVISLEISTEADRLNVHIYCLRAQAKRAGELLALALTQPMLADNDIARIKTQFGALFLELEEDPAYQANRLLEKRAFPGHPYANAAYGTPASLAILNAQDVRDFLSTYITRGNLTVSAAGDVDSGLLEDVLGPTVDALKNNDAGPVAVTHVTLQGAGETLRERSVFPQTVIAFAARGIPREDKRFYAAFLLNYILGGDPMLSRLGSQVRQEKGLVYDVDSSLESWTGTALITGTLAARNSNGEAALAEVKSVIQTLHDKGVTTEECSDAKSYIIGHFALQLDHSSAISAMLQLMQIHHLGVHYLTDRIGYFKDVSCSDLTGLATELFGPEKFLFAVVGGTEDTAAPAPAHGDTK